MPLYSLFWSELFTKDLARIAKALGLATDSEYEWFDRAYEALYEALQNAPFKVSKRLGKSDIHYIRTKQHFPAIPPLYITFRIERNPPDGEIELRRAVMEREVRDPQIWNELFEAVSEQEA